MDATAETPVAATERAAGRLRWGRLPDPVGVEDMREGQPAGEPLDPGLVFNPEREWLIRYGAALG
ncbi:hypothetical protein BH20ACT6_BH20ACT6_20870 [soil metagenome]